MTNSAKLWCVSVVSFSAVGFAVYSQQMWDMRPCPWCILQRMIFIAIFLTSALGAMLAHTPRTRRTFNPSRPALWPWLSIILMAGLGAGCAIYQNLVAANQASCSVSHAQSFIMATGLDELLPSLFMVTGTCADAATAKLLGLPYELISAALFILIVCLCTLTARSIKKLSL